MTNVVHNATCFSTKIVLEISECTKGKWKRNKQKSVNLGISILVGQTTTVKVLDLLPMYKPHDRAQTTC